jgi:hypothetical protein
MPDHPREITEIDRALGDRQEFDEGAGTGIEPGQLAAYPAQ